MPAIETVPLPVKLPAPATAAPDAAFPETLRMREGNNGNDRGVLRQGTHLFSAPDTDHMATVGADFLTAVSTAASFSASGVIGDTNVDVEPGTAVGVFRGTDTPEAVKGAYYLAPMYWNSEGNDEGTTFLHFNAGAKVTPLSTQLQAVVTNQAWADLRPSH